MQLSFTVLGIGVSVNILGAVTSTILVLAWLVLRIRLLTRPDGRIPFYYPFLPASFRVLPS
jgi:hypothetical protein